MRSLFPVHHSIIIKSGTGGFRYHFLTILSYNDTGIFVDNIIKYINSMFLTSKCNGRFAVLHFFCIASPEGEKYLCDSVKSNNACRRCCRTCKRGSFLRSINVKVTLQPVFKSPAQRIRRQIDCFTIA